MYPLPGKRGGRAVRQRGQAAIFISLSLIPMLGLLGLVVDVGWAYWRKEAAYTAAQSAAIAAALAVSTNTTFTCGSGGLTCQAATACPSNPTTPPSSNMINGCLYAKQNGFINSGNQNVTMAAGTSSSPVAGVSPTYWVAATVTERIPQTFSAVLGKPMSTVSQTAVAAVFASSGSGCFYILEPTSTGLNMSGGSIASNCGIYINSTGNSIIQSGGTVTVSGGGNVYKGGTWIHSGGTISPTPITGSGADPFASMADPSIPGSCVDTGQSWASGTHTLAAGKHCGSISISGGTITVSAGLHVFESGFSISGGTVSDDGLGGVMFYFDAGGLSMSGSTINLAAQTTGTYKGMLIFFKRSNSSAVSLSGGGLTLTGAVYAKASALSISGGTYTQTTFVINNVSDSGGTTATVNGGSNTAFTSSAGTTVSFIQ